MPPRLVPRRISSRVLAIGELWSSASSLAASAASLGFDLCRALSNG
ncbi:MAG: hypothetical protein HPY58_00225 [Firmicutes bacterium]|nr:hypothetical protein [Bacillota bacterium]